MAEGILPEGIQRGLITGNWIGTEFSQVLKSHLLLGKRWFLS
jgi:hypothetical protein